MALFHRRPPKPRTPEEMWEDEEMSRLLVLQTHHIINLLGNDSYTPGIPLTDEEQNYLAHLLSKKKLIPGLTLPDLPLMGYRGFRIVDPDMPREKKVLKDVSYFDVFRRCEKQYVLYNNVLEHYETQQCFEVLELENWLKTLWVSHGNSLIPNT